MNKNLTHLAFIIDASGSMANLRDDTIGGFNRILEEQQKASGESHITLVTFNTKAREVFTGVNAKHVRQLSRESYAPDGGTALYDALGGTIDRLGRLFAAMPEAQRPGKVLLTIITDGQENSSTDYKLAQIKKMVERQRAEYAWEFVYIGANVDAFGEASSMGMSVNNAYNYQSSRAGTAAVYGITSSSLRGYSEQGSSQMNGVINTKGVAPGLFSPAAQALPAVPKVVSPINQPKKRKPTKTP